MAARGFSPTQITNILKILKCDFCKCTLKEPRYLDCHHTFCTECLKDQLPYQDGHDQVGSFPRIIICPTCYKDTRLSLSDVRAILKSNKIIDGIIKLISTDSSNSDEVVYRSHPSIQIETYQKAADRFIKDSTSDFHGGDTSSIKEISPSPDFESTLSDDELNQNVLRRSLADRAKNEDNTQSDPPKPPANAENTKLIGEPEFTNRQKRCGCFPCCKSM